MITAIFLMSAVAYFFLQMGIQEYKRMKREADMDLTNLCPWYYTTPTTLLDELWNNRR